MSDKPIHHIIEDNEALVEECARLQSEVERLRGRCGDLESENKYLRARDDSLISFLVNEAGLDMVSVKAACGHIPNEDAWLLRKQADAVEPAIRTALRNLGNADLSEEDIERFAEDYAQRLRHQAAESEK